MCAWKNDLLSMRQSHSYMSETCKKYREIGDIIKDTFPAIEAMIQRNKEFFCDLPDVKDSLSKLCSLYGMMGQNLASCNDRLTRLEKEINHIGTHVKTIYFLLQGEKMEKECRQKKPWWKRIWNT